MALVTSKQMFAKAYDGGYAIGAFNVNNMEIVQGITEAAGELKSPVILQVSKGARAYANHTYLVKLVEAAVIENPDIPIALHLDHGDSFELCKDCIDSGVVDPNSKSFGYEETDDNFVNGFSASYVTGNWLQEKEDANPEVMSDVTVEPIPVPEGGTPATYMELKPLFLFNTSKNNDAAFDFATYVCGKEWQQDVYSSASPRSDVTVPGKWTEDFQALSDNGVAFPPVTLGSISQAMIDSIAKVLQEGMTPQAAAEWLADAVNTSLKESGELSAS